MSMYYTTIDSPVGALLLTSNGKALTGVYPVKHKRLDQVRQGRQDAAPFREAIRQLEEYFAGRRTSFDLPLETGGTAHQRKVWDGLRKIGHGKTLSYGQLAAKLGNPNASRAVGGANGRNPICIIIPCHRVIAADGTLGGYSGGLDMKQWLLRHEGISWK